MKYTYLVLLLSFLILPIQAKAIDASLFTPATSKAFIEVYAAMYGVSSVEMYKTLVCESGLNPRAINPTDGEGGSRGISQFQTSTFNHYAPLAGVTNPDIWNPLQQLQTMSYMFSIGEQKQWTCARSGSG